MKSFILFIVMFFLLYGPRLHTLDVYLYTNLLFSIIGLYLFARNKSIQSNFLMLLSILFIITTYFTILYIFNQYLDGFIYQWILTFIIYLFSSYAIVAIYIKKYHNAFEILAGHVFWATVINASVVIIVFISTDIANYLLDILNHQSNQEIWIQKKYRSFDLSIGGGAATSIAFAMVFFLGFLLQNSAKNFFFIHVGMLTILTGIILTGRTGFVLAVSLIPFYYLFIKTLLPNSKKNNTYSKIIQGILILSGILTLYYYTPLIFQDNEALMAWVFEIFDMKESQTIEDITNNMYFLPESYINLLFGEGNFGRNSNLSYIASDVGYVRMIFGGGIIGMILMLLPLILFLILSTYYSINNKDQSSLVVLLFSILYTIVNFKEFHYGTRTSMLILMIFVVHMIIHNRPKNKNHIHTKYSLPNNSTVLNNKDV